MELEGQLGTEIELAEEASPASAATASSQHPHAGLRWRSIKKYIVDPRRIIHRYFLLTLICCFIPGPYYHDSQYGAFKTSVVKALSLSNKEYAMLFALSSLTGIICGPAGALVAKTGRTRIVLAAGLGCTFGATFTVMGTELHMITVMLVGRILFWISLYMLMMVQTLLLYSLFHGSELTTAYSLLVFACRLGSVFGFFLSGPLMQWLGFINTMRLSGVLVLSSSITTLLFAYLFHGTATAHTVRPLLAGPRVVGKAFSLALLRAIPRSAFFNILALAAIYSAVFPFEVVADDMLQKDYSFDPVSAGYLVTVVPLVALATPFMAPLLGRSAKQKLLSASGGFLLIGVAQCIFISRLQSSLLLAFGLMGTGYSIGVSTLWTALPELVRATTPAEQVREVEGTATGLAYALLSLCQFASNFAVGIIKDMLEYRHVCMWFVLMAAVGIACALYSMVVHLRNVLGPPPGDSGGACGCRDDRTSGGASAGEGTQPGPGARGGPPHEEADGEPKATVHDRRLSGVSVVEDYCWEKLSGGSRPALALSTAASSAEASALGSADKS